MTQQTIDYAMQRLEEMYIHAGQHEGQITVSVWTKDLSDSFDMILSDAQVRDLADDVKYVDRRWIHEMSIHAPNNG